MDYIIEEGVCFWFLLQKGKRFVKVVVCVCVCMCMRLLITCEMEYVNSNLGRVGRAGREG